MTSYLVFSLKLKSRILHEFKIKLVILTEKEKKKDAYSGGQAIKVL